jgi:hypothetical protein
MTLVPLIVGLCLQVQDPKYQEACSNALTQGAQQTGIAQKFEHHTKKMEKRMKALVTDEKTAAVVFSVAGFAYQFSQNRESTLSMKVAPRTTAQVKFTQQSIGFGIRYDF